MVDKPDPNDPSNKSAAWLSMAPKWDMIASLLGGTATMRAKSNTYLPQHDRETDKNYQERLATTTLFNQTELTLNSLVGRPFRQPVILKDDVPKEIKDASEDIDLQGNNLNVVCRGWFRESLAKGFSHMMIDMPAISEQDRAIRTRADDLKQNNRPYWVPVCPENLIYASSFVENGVEKLSQARIWEEVTVEDEFLERTFPQIRVLRPGLWEIWRIVETKNNKPVWKMVDYGQTDLDYIPLVTFYAGHKEKLMKCKPPLEDLAYLNVRHWQSSSDQNNILTVTRFPILAGSGVTTEGSKEIEIGPRKFMGTKDPQGRFYYVEHAGAAIGAGREDLLDLEEMMASYGAEFLKRRPGNATATARSLNSAESTSELQDMSTRFGDAIEQALQITADWMGQEIGGSVKVNEDFGPDDLNEADLTALITARVNKEISHETFVSELKRRGVLSTDFDGTEDQALLEAEMRLIEEKEAAAAEQAQADAVALKETAPPVKEKTTSGGQRLAKK